MHLVQLLLPLYTRNGERLAAHCSAAPTRLRRMETVVRAQAMEPP
jgi:hypothetical protein